MDRVYPATTLCLDPPVLNVTQDFLHLLSLCNSQNISSDDLCRLSLSPLSTPNPLLSIQTTPSTINYDRLVSHLSVHPDQHLAAYALSENWDGFHIGVPGPFPIQAFSHNHHCVTSSYLLSEQAAGCLLGMLHYFDHNHISPIGLVPKDVMGYN